MADCSGVRTTGHWKGHRCGSPGLHIFDGKWWCANHFPINDSIEQIAYLKRQLSEANKKLDERRECRELSVRDGKIVAALEQQLAEARRKAFEEAAEIAEKMTPLSGMGVQTGRHIAKALREAGKRGLKV